MDYSWMPSNLDRHVQERFFFQGNQVMDPQSQMTLPHRNNPMLEQVAFFTNGGILQSLNAYSVAPQNNLNDSHSFNNAGVRSVTLIAAPPARTRRRKAPTLRAEDWEPVKSRIIELHITQNLPLPDVKKIIETEFKSSSFSATLRQYRTRISQWGLDKKVKSKEMEAIVRKRQRRKLVETEKGELAFRLRGNIVQAEKIDRWMKRNGITEDTLYAPSPVATTPAALSIWTNSERNSPAPSSLDLMDLFGYPSAYNEHPSPSSPTPSEMSLIVARSSAFRGRSPSITYRTLGVLEDLTITPTSPSQYHERSEQWGSRRNQPIISVQDRYRQEDEIRLRQTLLTFEVDLGVTHPETLQTLQDLGMVLFAQGRYKSSGEIFRKLVAEYQKRSGDSHSSTLHASEWLGIVFRFQGFYNEAECLQIKVYSSRRSALGEGHQDTLTSMANLAAIYSKQAQWKKAEKLDMQAMEGFKMVLGAEHPDTLTSMVDLAVTYHEQGRWKEAEELEMQTIEARKRVLGAEHPDTLTSMADLAATYSEQGRLNEAEELDMQTMEARKRVLGAEHPDTLTSMNNLAATYRDQGQWKEAEELGMQVVEARKRVLGAEHPNTLGSISNLAMTYSKQGLWKEAEELNMQVMNARKILLGAQHPDTLTSMNNLAFTLRDQNRNQEAQELMRECAELREQVLGLGHPATIFSRDTLNKWEMDGLDLYASEFY